VPAVLYGISGPAIDIITSARPKSVAKTHKKLRIGGATIGIAVIHFSSYAERFPQHQPAPSGAELQFVDASQVLLPDHAVEQLQHLGAAPPHSAPATSSAMQRSHTTAAEAHLPARDEPQSVDGRRHGYYTDLEERLFLEGLELFGRDWNKARSTSVLLADPAALQLQAHVKTRESASLRSHAQMHFIRLFREGKPLPSKVCFSRCSSNPTPLSPYLLFSQEISPLRHNDAGCGDRPWLYLEWQASQSGLHASPQVPSS
jgi:hypothetical protein